MASKARLAEHSAWSVLACLTAFVPGAAAAQSARSYAFSIKPEPAAEALIDFAIQAHISIGGVSSCRGRSAGLQGRYGVEDGLGRLLSRSGCGFRRVAPDTFQVFDEAPPKPAPPPARIASEPPPPPPPPAPPAAPAPAEAPVVVTTTKREALIASLPYAISALSHQQLEEAGALDVDDVAVQIPGLSTTNLGLGRDKILLRGLSDGVFTGRTQSMVGIYLDDVPLTYNAPDPDLQLADVEDVEVLRGPQGALYGAGAMSGVYRIVTRKPVLDAWSAEASAGGSLTNTGAPSYELEGMLNAPLVTDRLAVRAVAYQNLEGGYIDDTDLRLSNVDSTLRVGARVSARADLEGNWIVTAQIGYQSIDANDAQYVTPGAGRLHRTNQILESSRNNISESAITAEHSDSWGDFKSTTSFVEHKFSSRSDASDALPLFGFQSPAVGSYDEPIDIQMLNEDAVLTSPNVGRFQWLAGLFGSATWQNTTSTVRAGATGDNPTETLYSELRKDERDVAAFYGDASYALTSRLTATAGLRYAGSNAQVRSDVEAPQMDQSRRFDGQTAGSGLTPKLALSYALTKDDLIYVLASEGKRTGGINTGGLIGTMFATTPDAPGVHRNFGGDQLWNYETGVKLSGFGGRLSVNADLFYDVWTNIQTDQFMNSGISYTANAGDGRNLGTELELVAIPLRGLTFQATALLNRPELIHANPGFVAGVNLPGVPDVSMGSRIAYRHPVMWGISGLISAEAEYIGRSHLTFDPLTSPSMGGYVLSRLSAQLQRDNWRLALYLSNPTNARGNTFSYGNPFDFQQAQEVTPQRPTTLRAVLSRAF